MWPPYFIWSAVIALVVQDPVRGGGVQKARTLRGKVRALCDSSWVSREASVDWQLEIPTAAVSYAVWDLMVGTR